MLELLRFEPLYQERVWGGRALETALGRTLPAGAVIGESWEVVDRPEAQSVVAGGAWAGQTLHAVLQLAGADVMGPDWRRGRPFPILVKWLDCRERLSLQVHPPAEIAEELQGEPKTENWFIAATAPGSRLIVGLRRGTTRAQFERAIADGTVESCVHAFGVAAGDSILVHSGQVHAIDAGNLILEIQQNSDTTYRVFDWNRTGLDGKPRELHREPALESIDFSDTHPELIPEFWTAAAPGVAVRPLVRNPLFCVDLVRMESGSIRGAGVGKGPVVIGGVSGTVRLIVGDDRREVRPGEFVLIPAVLVAGARLESVGASEILMVADGL
jgi:mannose-6-phosphate isomerase